MAATVQQNVQMAPMVINVNPTNPGEKYKSKYKALGITQLVLASLSILLATILVCITDSYDTFAYIGTGIWSGGVFLVPGILGVIGGKRPTRCVTIGAMVMTIISSIFAIEMISLELNGVALANRYWGSQVSPNVVIHSMLAIIALAMFITTIVHSAYCCAGTNCCCNGSNMNTQQVIYTQPGTYPNQVLLQTPGNPGVPVQVVYQSQIGNLPTTSIPQQQFVQQETLPPQAPPYQASPPFYQPVPQNMDEEPTKLPL